MADLQKPREEVFYLPMHAVLKESSITTKVRAVFDASAKSSSGVALNDQLLVGPTIHSTLVDVLLSFRLYRVALTTDVSKMYRAVILPPEDRDLHRFVWRGQLDEPLKDYRMTRVTFGISSSSFAANMCVRQNAVDLFHEYPLAASAIEKSFYVDDGLCGADTVEKAVQLQNQLQAPFSRGGFLLRKWKSSEPSLLQHVPPHLLDSQPSHSISEAKVSWDEHVPVNIHQSWRRWREKSLRPSSYLVVTFQRMHTSPPCNFMASVTRLKQHNMLALSISVWLTLTTLSMSHL
jgi:hypothetical protein